MLVPDGRARQCQSGPMKWQKRLPMPVGAGESLHVALSDAAVAPGGCGQ
jgi:hypothetical protein